MKSYSITLLLMMLAGSGGLIPLEANATGTERGKTTTHENLRDKVKKILDELNQNATLQSTLLMSAKGTYSSVLREHSKLIDANVELVRDSLYLELETKILNEAKITISPIFPKILGDFPFKIERLPEKITAIKANSYNIHTMYDVFLIIQIRLSITEKGDKILRDWGPQGSLSGAGVVASVHGIRAALNKLDLLPTQKKMLEGFKNVTDRFSTALTEETQKMERGEEYRNVIHEDFRELAMLLVAYHQYLEEILNESARLESVERGPHEINVAMVSQIKTAVDNIAGSRGYGFKRRNMANRHASYYSRVMNDLIMNQLHSHMSEAQKKHLSKPILLALGEIRIKSEGGDDSRITDDVKALKDAWENKDFREFMVSRATSQDNFVSGLIMNLDSLAYKIGKIAGIKIDVLRTEDLDFLKKQGLAPAPDAAGIPSRPN